MFSLDFRQFLSWTYSFWCSSFKLESDTPSPFILSKRKPREFFSALRWRELDNSRALQRRQQKHKEAEEWVESTTARTHQRYLTKTDVSRTRSEQRIRWEGCGWNLRGLHWYNLNVAFEHTNRRWQTGGSRRESCRRGSAADMEMYKQRLSRKC